MSEKLEDLLIDLSSNPDQRSRFENNPDEVLAQSALTPTQRTAVTSRDSQLLADALGSTGFSLGLGVQIITPLRAPTRRKAPGKKKTPARKKAPARKKTPARKKAPARKRAPAKRTPSRRAPAKRAPAKKSPRRPAPRKKR